MDGFVSAYSKTTGQIQRIPADWIGHPMLGRDFELTPEEQALQAANVPTPSEPEEGQVEQPSESWTRERLDAYAREVHDLDTSELRTKADVVAAIEAAVDAEPQDPGGNPPPDQTPATGEEEE